MFENEDLVRHELAPAQALTYITAGRGKATLVGESTRFTYRFKAPDDHSCVWVSVLSGPENTNDYQYIGFISTRDGNSPELIAGRKGKAHATSFQALAWYVNKAFHNPDVAAKAHFWHEGICGKCGRPLTVPESIERGIGPKCWAGSGNVLSQP